MNKGESKYFRTEKRMADALLALLTRKEFPYISVKEVCDAADVSRSTFYLHYENTAELLAAAVARVHEQFRSTIPEAAFQLDAIQCRPREELYFVTDRWLLPYLEFVRENKSVYKAIHTQVDAFGTERAYRDFFEGIFSPILTRFGVAQDKHEYIMTFYRHGLAAVLMKWVDEDCREAQANIAAVIKQCVGGPDSAANPAETRREASREGGT